MRIRRRATIAQSSFLKDSGDVHVAFDGHPKSGARRDEDVAALYADASEQSYGAQDEEAAEARSHGIALLLVENHTESI